MRARGLLADVLAPPRLAPYEAGEHHDFKPGEGRRLHLELAFAGATEGDAALFEPGEPARVMRLGELVRWLVDNALDDLARRVRNTEVPPGRVLVLLVGDEAARIRLAPLPDPVPNLCPVMRVLR
ncbi:MAG: hypothetical protein JWP97_5399 [Labilithrix sp.]|nr:hypothetical protein [Labilithrix sp.]